MLLMLLWADIWFGSCQAGSCIAVQAAQNRRRGQSSVLETSQQAKGS
jgi:hypothetical protein